MPLRPWDPLCDLVAMQDRLERMAAASPGWLPAIDLYETADEYVLAAELPGLARSDIEIAVRDRALTLQGTRAAAALPLGQYLQVERGHGAFGRTFTFPLPVDAEAVVVDLQDGVLTIRIPKAKPPQPRRIAVE